MSQGMLFGAVEAPVVEETEASLTAQIAALDEARDVLIQRRDALRKAAKEAELRAKFAALPPEVQEMLRAEKPAREWLARLRPRNLAERDPIYGCMWTWWGREMRRAVFG